MAAGNLFAIFGDKEEEKMYSQKMYELGSKKSTIRTIFEYGKQRAAIVGEENIYDHIDKALQRAENLVK